MTPLLINTVGGQGRYTNMAGFLDFAGGFAREATEQQREKNKLALAMQSRAIEAQLQQQQAMQMAQFNQQLNQVDPQKLGALAQLAGASPEAAQGLQNIGPIPSNLATSALGALGAGNRIPQMGFEKATDSQGNQTLIPVNRKTGQVGQGQTIGLTGSASHAIASAGAAYGTMHNTLENVRSRMSQFLGAQDATQLPAQVLGLKLNQVLQNNPEAKAYFDDLPALSLRIDKELTGSSRNASNIVEGTQHGLPQMTDTVATAMKKLDNYDMLGKAAANATYDAYSVPQEQRNFGQPAQAAAQPQGLNFSHSDIEKELQRRAAIKGK